jgi:hypothetical protein
MENIKKIQIDITESLNKKSHDENNIKRIHVDLTPKKERNENKYDEPEPESEPVEKIPRKRVITSQNEWNFTETDLMANNQTVYIQQIYNKDITPENVHKCKIVLQQLRAKISGYRNQDVIKNLYSEDNFITIDRIIQLLVECNCCCYYCKSNTKVLYEYVREPTQWSLERIDNSIGHNNDNVMIACLNCNLRRRTMNQERYVFTKQLILVKK